MLMRVVNIALGWDSYIVAFALEEIVKTIAIIILDLHIVVEIVVLVEILVVLIIVLVVLVCPVVFVFRHLLLVNLMESRIRRRLAQVYIGTIVVLFTHELHLHVIRVLRSVRNWIFLKTVVQNYH